MSAVRPAGFGDALGALRVRLGVLCVPSAPGPALAPSESRGAEGAWQVRR